MPNNWLKALKEYNQDKCSYTIPKKNTKCYQDVIKIKDRLDGKIPVEPVSKVKKVLRPKYVPEPIKPIPTLNKTPIDKINDLIKSNVIDTNQLYLLKAQISPNEWRSVQNRMLRMGFVV